MRRGRAIPPTVDPKQQAPSRLWGQWVSGETTHSELPGRILFLIDDLQRCDTDDTIAAR